MLLITTRLEACNGRISTRFAFIMSEKEEEEEEEEEEDDDDDEETKEPLLCLFSSLSFSLSVLI